MRADRTTPPTPSRARLTTTLLGLLLAACSGSDGKDGKDGVSPTIPTDTNLSRFEDAPGVVLEITAMAGGTAAGGNFKAGDAITVTFTAKKNDGTNWNLAELASGHIIVSGPTFNYQPVLPDTTDVLTAAHDNLNGTWSYTFATRIPSTYPPPLNDSPAFGAGDGELQGQTLLDGTYTVGLWCRWNYTVEGQSFKDVGQTTKDFLFGGTSTATAREVVKTDNCNRCHTTLQAHGGSRRTVPICLLCHTSGAEDSSGNGVSIDFRVMIHKLHNASHLPSVLGVATFPDGTGTRNYAATPIPYVVGGTDFSFVAFPVWPNLNTSMPRDFGYSALTSDQKALENTMLQGATECSKCHGDPDGSGPLTPPAQGDIAQTQPSRRACGACHDDVDWTQNYKANQQTMGQQPNDSSCKFCHAPSGGSLAVADAHLHPINNPAINPGVDFAITSMGGGSGAGGNFVAGDKPTITFTLKDDSGVDVPLASLDSTSTILVGPTNNYQHVFPFASPNGASSGLPVDFSGRLVAASTSNKGSMSKVDDASVTESLVVQFVNATDFTVTGTASGGLGGASLPAAASTNPSGASLGSLTLTSAAVPQTVTVDFSSNVAFSVTGSVSGAMGSSTMPASTNASTAFTSTDGSLTFILTTGSNAFAAGNSFALVVFRCGAADPALFAVVAGSTSFATNDRFYYDTVANAATYTYALPMDIPTEFLGDGTGAAGQVLTAANVPVYFGRQTLSERTGLAGAATTLAAASGARDRFVVVAAIDAGLAIGDTAVLDNGVAGLEEYALIGFIDVATNKIWFRTPLRFPHASGAGFQEATLATRLQGVHYSLDPAAGTITSLGAGFGLGNALVLSYRTDGAFGWFRAVGDTLQSVYVPPINDSPDLEQSWGEWSGLPFVDGTYSASIWGRKNTILEVQNEVQTYNGIGEASTFNLLFGGATTVDPYHVISTGDNCNACHTMVGPFHGGNRRDFNTCVLCHGVAGSEDWPIYGTKVATLPTTGVTINFRTMLHKVHRGSELFDKDYAVLGNNSSVNTYGEIVFPAMPSGTMECTKCHGTADNWNAPGNRQHPAQTTPTREWRAACGACHDSPADTGHIDAMTSPAGLESCEVCHGSDAEFSVELMHKVR
jgi:OmcA/MtrC family decaheme c-type cytochrome